MGRHVSRVSPKRGALGEKTFCKSLEVLTCVSSPYAPRDRNSRTQIPLFPAASHYRELGSCARGVSGMDV